MSWPLHPEQPQTLARNNFLTPFLRLPALWETVTFAENLLCAELIGMIIIIPTIIIIIEHYLLPGIKSNTDTQIMLDVWICE